MRKLFFNKYWMLLCIVLCACILRFYELGDIPLSLTWDEAAWGYNAYSIGINGKDEFGRFLPYTYLESFGDFKPPMYAYLDVIPVKIFGLTEFATRFPSALFGVLTVLVSYFLVKCIFYSSKHKELYALLSSLFLGCSPWHIMLSRAAFEANVASFFIVTGVWLFLAGTQQKRWLLFLSVLSFIFSMYTFNSARVVAPLLGCALFLGFWRLFWTEKKMTVGLILFASVCLLPLVPFLLSPQANLRYREVNIFSDLDVIKRTNQEIQNTGNTWWGKILHNRRVAYGQDYIKHYLDHFSPNYLFISGDINPKFSIQDVGQMYLLDIPFLILGSIFLFRRKEGKWWVIPVWLLLGIIPAATARETPHALRTEVILPTLQMMSAYGCAVFLLWIKQKKRLYSIGLSIILLSLLFFTARFAYIYLKYYPQTYASEWQYGYKEVYTYAASVGAHYDQIRMTTDLGRPYIYLLFYDKIQPSDFQKESIVKRDSFGFVDVTRVGEYYFDSNLLNSAIPESKHILYINRPSLVPKNAKVLRTFYLPNNQPALVAYEQ